MTTEKSIKTPPSGVLAVLVLYRTTAQQSRAWPFLQRAIRPPQTSDRGQPEAMRLRHIVVYDNSPVTQAPSTLPPDVSYVHDPSNAGTAGAYAKAFAMADAMGCEWVLLLDHDTALPDIYLEAAYEAAQRAQATDGQLLAPWVMHGVRCISPSRRTRWGGFARLDAKPGTTPTTSALSCIASGCLLDQRARALIGAFPAELWLDFVDHWMVCRVQRGGGKLALIDATLQHDLSVERPTALSAERLASVLAGERYFMAQCGWAARITYPFRLALRAINYARQGTPLWRDVLRALT
ncbi:MAG: hypothetical protein DI603_22325 [Roseateles depolymerans]|uniref:Glycosyltransferase 2-like domain-containing protein n=1 Tax=Roseateles depolymerans TaxID=76731 RepID=A0A2W5F491_9BURK|nr:MAG: hypothetical protein DI603_22325 [Roseateles depolymerans]